MGASEMSTAMVWLTVLLVHSTTCVLVGYIGVLRPALARKREQEQNDRSN